MQISPRLNQRRSIQQQERNALLRASIASKDLTDMQKIAVRHITPNKEIRSLGPTLCIQVYSSHLENFQQFIWFIDFLIVFLSLKFCVNWTSRRNILHPNE